MQIGFELHVLEDVATEHSDEIDKQITRELADFIYKHKDQILEIKDAECEYDHEMIFKRVRMVIPDVLCKDCVMYAKENMYCKKYNEMRMRRDYCSKGLTKEDLKKGI